jgi:hypothetical protein
MIRRTAAETDAEWEARQASCEASFLDELEESANAVFLGICESNSADKLRGRCKELAEEACRIDPTLALTRGFYFCPIWNVEEQHWWCVRQDGTIFDPTARQFPSAGLGIYRVFDGMCECAECGKQVPEDKAYFESNYAFCSSRCFGFFVGGFV